MALSSQITVNSLWPLEANAKLWDVASDLLEEQVELHVTQKTVTGHLRAPGPGFLHQIYDFLKIGNFSLQAVNSVAETSRFCTSF